jgi:predicted PurR-regulated permease PerM
LETDPPSRELHATVVDITVRLAALALLVFWAVVLVQPFLTIAIWSAVLVVALYPTFAWLAAWVGQRLAAALLTIVGLLIIIGPATWLGLGLVEGLRSLSDRLGSGVLGVPAPPETVKGWPLIGNQLYQFWELASTNLEQALGEIALQLKPYTVDLLGMAGSAGGGIIKFFASVILMGFLFSPAPALAAYLKGLARRIESDRGEEFVELAGKTIRSVSRGVIGVSLLQAFAAGIGLWIAAIPGASLITFAVLVLGIIQIGPSIVLIPVIIWSWLKMGTMAAVIFTAYMLPVNLMDNVLRPIVMGRGLRTPILITFIGVIGGTLVHGLIGLFLGPVVLAVAWELLVAWIRDEEAVAPAAESGQSDVKSEI